MRSARTLTCFCLPGDIGRVRTRPWRIHRWQILIERSPVGKGVDLREVDNLRRLLGMWFLWEIIDDLILATVRSIALELMNVGVLKGGLLIWETIGIIGVWNTVRIVGHFRILINFGIKYLAVHDADSLNVWLSFLRISVRISSTHLSRYSGSSIGWIIHIGHNWNVGLIQIVNTLYSLFVGHLLWYLTLQSVKI